MKRSMLTMLAAAALLSGLAAPATAASEDDGQAVYEQACAACHQPNGQGIPGSFPPLAGNPNAADPEYVADVIRNGLSGPIEVNGETYDGIMPAVTTLSDAQIASVVAYVVDLAGADDAPAETQPIAAPATGDAGAGEALFLGGAVFDNGGPACAGCHAAGSFDHLGGNGLGPDLTATFTKFGGAPGLAAALAAPPSPTMTPLFADHPLTDAEIADLTAFFAAVETHGNGGGFDLFWIFGLAGLGALLAFLAVFVRKPSGSYVEKLRSAA